MSSRWRPAGISVGAAKSHTSEAKPVRSWRSILLLIIGALLVHAIYSEWLFSVETAKTLTPDFGQTFEQGATLYQQEINKIADLLGLGP